MDTSKIFVACFVIAIIIGVFVAKKFQAYEKDGK